MSGLIPEGATLQFSNPVGDIVHQGILGSNASGSTLLTSTFPTTSTGTSLGHYHYTDSTTKSLKFLNASGTGDGGHQFFHSSSTQAPLKTLEANRTGVITSTNFSVEKSVTPTPPVYSPNVQTLLPDGRNIELDGDLYAPPYNFQNQTFNPVYMTQTTALYTTGDLCYVVAGSDRVIQIFNNNNITNPIPPNVVPSDFGNSSNVGFTVGIPLFSLSPVLPSTTQTTILSDTLTITTDTDESILSATDLTFGGTSLVTTVSTNTSNIATNTSNIATNTSNIATNTSNIATNTSNIATNTSDINILEVKQTNVLQVYASPAIYADGAPPLPVPSISSNTYAQFGWYFKNSTTGLKINWYQPPATGMKVSDIIGLYLRFFSCGTTSNDNTPFLTVLTTPTGSGDFFPGFFHSSMTYIFSQSVNPVVNTSYTMFENVTGTCPNPSSYASNLVSMEQSPVNNPRGVYAGTDSVLAIVIGTNSASAVNSVEFIAQKLGVMTLSGTQELLYQTLI